MDWLALVGRRGATARFLVVGDPNHRCDFFGMFNLLCRLAVRNKLFWTVMTYKRAVITDGPFRTKSEHECYHQQGNGTGQQGSD